MRTGICSARTMDGRLMDVDRAPGSLRLRLKVLKLAPFGLPELVLSSCQQWCLRDYSLSGRTRIVGSDL